MVSDLFRLQQSKRLLNSPSVCYLLLHVQALRPDVSLEHLPFLRLRTGLPVNEDIVDAALTVAEEKAAGFTPSLKKTIGQRVKDAGIVQLFCSFCNLVWPLEGKHSNCCLPRQCRHSEMLHLWSWDLWHLWMNWRRPLTFVFPLAHLTPLHLNDGWKHYERFWQPTCTGNGNCMHRRGVCSHQREIGGLESWDPGLQLRRSPWC